MSNNNGNKLPEKYMDPIDIYFIKSIEKLCPYLKQVGFIAQEVNKLVPEVITGIEGDLEKGEILGITYANLVAVLTKAIQEQQKQIDGLNKQVEVQSKKIDYLTTLMDAKK